MRTRAGCVAMVTALVAVTIAGCTGAPDVVPTETQRSDADRAFGVPLWQVSAAVDLVGSPAYDRMVQRDGVVIGIPRDVIGVPAGEVPAEDARGFDADIGRWIAASLGFAPERVTFVVPSGGPGRALAEGTVDYVVGTTKEESSEGDAAFAGPYARTGQGLLVPHDSDITGPDGLGDRTVCTVAGSNWVAPAKKAMPQARIVTEESLSSCADLLSDGSALAVSADQTLLADFVARAPDDVRLAGEPFTTVEDGVAFASDDAVLAQFVRDLLQARPDVVRSIVDDHFAATGLNVGAPDPEGVG